jgi:plastocyanin
MMKLGLGLLAVAGLSGLVLAPGLAPAQAPSPKTYTVEVKNHQFLVDGKAQPLRIKGGDKVVWINRDRVPHTATSDRGAPFKFDTGVLRKDVPSSPVTFPAGDYTVRYHCDIHPVMRSSVIVGNGPTPARVAPSAVPHAH